MRSLKRLGVTLAATMLVALAIGPGTALAADENHGIGLNKGCIGATRIGDAYKCSYGITNNQDEAHDTLTITSLVDTVNRPGSPNSGNILQVPGIGSIVTFERLPGNTTTNASCSNLGTPTAICSLPNLTRIRIGGTGGVPGFSFYTVVAADFTVNANHRLTDTVHLLWQDTCSSGTNNCPDGDQDASTGSSTLVVKLASDTATDIHNAAHAVVTIVAAGSTVHDFVRVTGQTGQPNPGGMVDIDWFLNGTCSGSPAVNSGSVGPLNAAGQFDATAFAFTVNAPGMRSFLAHYEGDGRYNPSNGLCEPLRVVDAYIDINPPVDTNPVTATHTFTASVFVNDGGGAGYVAAPNGTAVTFAYVGGHVGNFKPDVPAGTNPNPCATVGGSCGIDTTSTSAGNDTMRASASLSVFGIPFSLTTGTAKPGHVNSDDATKHWADDSVRTDVHDAAHNVITTAEDTTVVHDKAFVTRDPATSASVPDPTGTIVFHRYATLNCTGASVDEIINLAANGTAESSVFTMAGTDVSYIAHYSGDANYPARDGACEPLRRLVPAIHIVKLTNGTDNDLPTGPVVQVGSTVTWTYNVTNPGDVPLHDVVVTDNIAGVTPAPVLSGGFNVGDTNHDNLLQLGETWVFKATGIATLGQYSNVGTVTGKSPANQTVTDNNPDHYVGVAPAINILKKTNGQPNACPPTPVVAAGSTVTWTYDVTNPDTFPLSNIVVTDDAGTPGVAGDDFTATPVLSGGFNTGDTNSNGKLDPGETWHFTASGTAKAGQYNNIATVNGDSIASGVTVPVSDTDDDCYFGSAPAIHIVKLTNGTDNDSPTGPHVAVGSTVTWTYVVTNTGNVPLHDVVVTDNVTGVTPTAVLSGGFNVGDANHDNLLDLTETWRFTASGTAVAGQYSNIGTVNGKSPIDQPVTDDNPDHYFGDAPAIKIIKYVNGDDADLPTGPHVAVGSTVTFTYVVTNTGNVPLANVAVTDDKLGTVTSFSGDTNNNGLLDLTETWTYTKTATAVAGQQTNVGTVVGNDVNNPPGTQVTDHNPANYFGDAPAIKIIKYVNGDDADLPTGPHVAVGSTVTFTYVVTNTGNVPLANVAVTDDKLGTVTSFSGDTNNNGLLDLTETWTYTKTATAVAGQQTNVGTVVGNDVNNPPGTQVTDHNPANYFGDAPAIKIIKYVNGDDADNPTGPIVAVGSTVTFTYVVTNTGNVPLANVTVTDDKLGAITSFSGDANNNGLLDLTETWTYTKTSTALAGQRTNVGTVVGNDVNNPPGTQVTDNNPANYFGVTPSINIVKKTNTTDNVCPPATGPVVAVGSTVTWTYFVTNTDTVPITITTIRDDNGTPGNTADDFTPTSTGGDSNSNGKLDVGETWTYSATGTATAGQYNNLVTVNGNTTVGGTTIPVTDNDPDCYFGAAPQIKIIKLTNGTDNDSPTGPLVPVGSTVTWTYNVTNPGNVPVSNVVVTDNVAGVTPAPVLSAGFNTGDTNHDNKLDTTETWVFTATGTATAGQYSNVGTVNGNYPPTGQTVTDTNPDHYFGVTPAINIVKKTNTTDNVCPPATGPVVAVGSTVTWTYFVTNTDTVPITITTIRDDNGTPGNTADDFTPTSTGGDSNSNGKLDVGETWTYSATGTATAGQYNNLVTVNGNTTVGGTTIPVTDNDPDCYFGAAPQIKIIKLTNGTDNDSPTGPLVPVGSTVTWTYNVTNPGNVPVSNVVVTDNVAGVTPAPVLSAGFNTGDTNHDNKLDTTETWVFTATGTATAGQYSNVGTVNGNYPPTGQTVTDTNPDHYFGQPIVTPCPAGQFDRYLDPTTGDFTMIYDQFPAPNDSTYGVNAVGWGTKGHTFGDLTGSDKSGYEVVNPAGTVVLDFYIDHISQTTVTAATPSGYGSLGPFGGDGTVNVGTLTTNDLTWDTAISRNLNKTGYFVNGTQTSATLNGTDGTNLLVNSPATFNTTDSYDLRTPSTWNKSYTNPEVTNPNYVGAASVNGWNYRNTFFVTLKQSKLLALGAIEQVGGKWQLKAGWSITSDPLGLHNSPAKPCPVSDTGANVSVTKWEVKDKQVKLTLTNKSTTVNSILTNLKLTWPQATNGNLTQIKLDGDVIWNGPAVGGGSIDFGVPPLIADATKRTIAKNSSDVLTFIFANNAAPLNNAAYSGTASFGATDVSLGLPH